jgi:hypothetical protein
MCQALVAEQTTQIDQGGATGAAVVTRTESGTGGTEVEIVILRKIETEGIVVGIVSGRGTEKRRGRRRRISTLAGERA